MTAEGTRPVRTESRVRIIKVIKSQGAAHTCIQIPITNPECPIPPAAVARPSDDGVGTRSRQRTYNVSEGATGKMSVGTKAADGEVSALSSPPNNNCTPRRRNCFKNSRIAKGRNRTTPCKRKTIRLISLQIICSFKRVSRRNPPINLNHRHLRRS